MVIQASIVKGNTHRLWHTVYHPTQLAGMIPPSISLNARVPNITFMLVSCLWLFLLSLISRINLIIVTVLAALSEQNSLRVSINAFVLRQPLYHMLLPNDLGHFQVGSL